jgi:hypothetical protein
MRLCGKETRPCTKGMVLDVLDVATLFGNSLTVNLTVIPGNDTKTPSKVTVKNPFFFWPSQTCFWGVWELFPKTEMRVARPSLPISRCLGNLRWVPLSGWTKLCHLHFVMQLFCTKQVASFPNWHCRWQLLDKAQVTVSSQSDKRTQNIMLSWGPFHKVFTKCLQIPTWYVSTAKSGSNKRLVGAVISTKCSGDNWQRGRELNQFGTCYGDGELINTIFLCTAKERKKCFLS